MPTAWHGDPILLVRAGARDFGSTDAVTIQREAASGRPAGSPFGLWSDPVLLLALLGLWTALAIVFNGEPEIDRGVSRFFFAATACAGGVTSKVCGGFPASISPFWVGVRGFFHYLPAAVTVVVLAALARELASGRGLAGRGALYASTALAAFALGPGLLVNGFLKEYWGRPRPYSTDLFGGDLPFVPAGRWSDACASNCSFVSGEAASIFWLICLIPLLPERRRRAGGVAIVAAAAFTAGLRIAFGGHYLSDVVLGGLSTLVVFAFLAVLAERLRPGR